MKMRKIHWWVSRTTVGGLLFLLLCFLHLADENKLWHDYADIMNTQQQKCAILDERSHTEGEKKKKRRLDPFAALQDKKYKMHTNLGHSEQSAASPAVLFFTSGVFCFWLFGWGERLSLRRLLLLLLFLGPCKRGPNAHQMKPCYKTKASALTFRVLEETTSTRSYWRPNRYEVNCPKRTSSRVLRAIVSTCGALV